MTGSRHIYICIVAAAGTSSDPVFKMRVVCANAMEYSTANVALITVNICALKANTQMHEADRERKRKKQQC